MSLLSANPFAAGAFVVLGTSFLILAVVKLRLGLASRTWDAVSGEIIESRVKWRGHGIIHGWLVEIRYRYMVEGLTYEGDQFGFGKDLSFPSRGAAERAASMYPKGGMISLLVSPLVRSVAVIEPGVGWLVWLMFFGGALMTTLSITAIISLRG